MLGQRLLQDDSVHGRIRAVAFESVAHLRVGNVLAQNIDLDLDADLCAQRLHSADVRETRVVFTDHRYQQARRDADFAQRRCLGLEVCA